jgi:hypothetical protein
MEPNGYVFQPFPKCKYHPDGRGVVVKDAGEELALGPEWADHPVPPVEAPTLEAAPPSDDARDAPSEPVRRPRGRPRKVVP